MAKRDGMKKAGRLAAVLITLVMIVCAAGYARIAQNTFASAEEGLSAYEQVMDDNGAEAGAEKETLAAHEQVME